MNHKRHLLNPLTGRVYCGRKHPILNGTVNCQRCGKLALTLARTVGINPMPVASKTPASR